MVNGFFFGPSEMMGPVEEEIRKRFLLSKNFVKIKGENTQEEKCK